MASVGIERAGSFLPSILVNVLLFASLAKGRPWARRFTIAMLVPTAVVHVIAPFVPQLGGPGIFAGLLNGAVYGAAAVVLWRSRTVRAYLESQQGQVTFPKSRQSQATLPKREA